MWSSSLVRYVRERVELLRCEVMFKSLKSPKLERGPACGQDVDKAKDKREKKAVGGCVEDGLLICNNVEY